MMTDESFGKPASSNKNGTDGLAFGTSDSDHQQTMLDQWLDQRSSRDSEMPDDLLAQRAQLIGTMTSYSVYQLSEGTEHKQYVECQTENMGDLILVDAGDGGESQYQKDMNRLSYMSGFSRGFMGINYDADQDEEMKGEIGMVKSFEKSSKAGGRTFLMKPKQFLVAKNSLMPAHHLFDLLEQEISRHQSHTNQSYFNIKAQKMSYVSNNKSGVLTTDNPSKESSANTSPMPPGQP